MKCKLKVLGLLLTGLVLTGCTNESTEQPVAVVSSEATESPTAKPLSIESKEFGVGDKIPLVLSNGRDVGVLRLNQVTKVRINDWKNTKAVEAGVSYSYSFNFSVKINFSKLGASNTTLKCEPILMNGNTQVSSVCNNGWTGFNTTAELFEDNSSAVFEVGMQPEQTSLDECRIQLLLTDSLGTEFTPIRLKRSVLSKAVKGPKLRYLKDITKIKSASGAVYGVTVNKVAFEPGKSELEIVDSDGQYYQVQYSVYAYKKPTSSRSVACISRYKNAMCLKSSVVFGLQADNASDVLYQSFPKAVRRTFADSDLACEEYVDGLTMIPFGKYFTAWTNRLAKTDDSSSPGKVRIAFEFPDEMSVRILEEKLKFNGRFVVYEVPITSRNIPNKY